MSEPTHKLLRFGVYEMNLDTEELRNAGTLVKLSPQPFKLLSMLASRAGQIVTREEIEKQLWGEDTYVDFDQGVNKCIKQIRNVLNDNADRPLYIETLPRRGYRFMAPVVSKSVPAPPARVIESQSDVIGQPRAVLAARMQSAATAQSAPSPDIATVQPEHDKPAVTDIQSGSLLFPNQSPPPQPHGRFRLRRPITALILAGLLAITASLALYPWLRRNYLKTSHVKENDTVVVADFINTSGDSLFDDSLRQALAIQMEQSPYVNVLSDKVVLHILQLMSLPASERLTQQVANAVCLRGSAKAVLLGSIASDGEHYKLRISALNCETSSVIARVEGTAEGRNKVLQLLGGLGNELRKDLGESLPSIQRFNQPLEEATTESLEALQAYSSGRIRQTTQAEDPSIYYKQAIAADPNFARAYSALGSYYENLGETGVAAENYTKAFELRDRVSQRERYHIEAHYYEAVTGELDRAIRVYRDWIQAYPRDHIPPNNLNQIYNSIGEFEKAAAEARESIRLRPENANAYHGVMRSYVFMNRPEEAKAVYQQAREHQIATAKMSLTLYLACFLAQDKVGMKSSAEEAIGRATTESVMLSQQADTEAYYGRIHQARVYSKNAVRSARDDGDSEQAALLKANEALRNAELGLQSEAKADIDEALSTNRNLTVRIVAAMVFARLGERKTARDIADHAEHEKPRGTLMQEYVLPAIRAAIELDGANPARAIELLQATSPYELGDATVNTANFGNAYPIYIRGLAYLQLKKPDLAALEFRKILDHPGVPANFIIAPLAKLYLARSLALAGDTGQARKLYQDLLALWNTADPTLPLLRTVKAEYFSLH